MPCRYTFTLPNGTTETVEGEAAAAALIRKHSLWEGKARIERADFTTDTMAAMLRQSVFGEHNFSPENARAFQVQLLDEFMRMEAQSDYFFKLGPIVALTKGLGKNFEHIDKIKQNLEDLGVGGELPKGAPFDARYVITGDPAYLEGSQSGWFHNISANNVKIMREIDSLSKTMFMERTDAFRGTLNKVIANLKSGLTGTKVQEIKDELSAFYQIAAYKKWMVNNHKATTTLRNTLIYEMPRTQPNIVEIVNEAIRLAPDNKFLSLILPVSTTVKIGGKLSRHVIHRDLVNTIEGKTRGKLEPDVIAAMMDSFMELYNNPNTKFHAKALFDYLIVKDGLMFKNKSFIKLLPTIMFEEMSEATDMATKVLAAQTIDEYRVLIREFQQKRLVNPSGKVTRIFSPEDVAALATYFAPDTQNFTAIRNLVYERVFGQNYDELYNSFENIYGRDVRYQFNLQFIKHETIKKRGTNTSIPVRGIRFEAEKMEGIPENQWPLYMQVELMHPQLRGMAYGEPESDERKRWNEEFKTTLETLEDAGFAVSPLSNDEERDENNNVTRRARTWFEFKKFIRIKQGNEYFTYELVSVRRDDARGEKTNYVGRFATAPGELVPRGNEATYRRVFPSGAGNATGVANLGYRPTRDESYLYLQDKINRDQRGLPPAEGGLPVQPTGPIPTPGTGGSALPSPDDSGMTITRGTEDPLDDHPFEQGKTPTSKVEIWKGTWTRQQVAQQTDKVFLFGDNTDDRINTHYVPSSTQAVIRGLPNAIGIDTKKNRGTDANSYFSDADFDKFKEQVDDAIQAAKESGKTIVIPEGGIGTGKAMLSEKAPRLYAYLRDQLNLLAVGKTTSSKKAAVSTQVSADPYDYSSIQELTLHSGGADGGDTVWHTEGVASGLVDTKHYREPEAKYVDSKILRGSYQVKPTLVEAAEYEEGKVKAEAAAKRIGRQISKKYPHYQYRNWSQVKHADAIFAVGVFLTKGTKITFNNIESVIQRTQIAGGTGYAVDMAVEEGKPVFVFDQNLGRWYKAKYKDVDGRKVYDGWTPTETPILTRSFAGIGTREINEAGIKAIQDVYTKTREWLENKNNPPAPVEPTGPDTNPFAGTNTFGFDENTPIDNFTDEQTNNAPCAD
jgi:hypothetical protein